MPHYFNGKILFVDLTTGAVTTEALEEDVYREFIGGYGLAVRIIYEKQPAKVDPLGPDNILAFMPGLLSGTGAPFSGRFSVAGKSPLTGTWGDSSVGGNLGQALKRAGYDGLFLTGISSQPVWLRIEDDRVTLENAAPMWGLGTADTEAAIRETANNKHTGVVTIGPAGEASSLLACIISDGGRAAGRSGLGAVMGSKRLKAVAVTGSGELKPVDPDALRHISDGIATALKPLPGLQKAMLRMFEPLMPRMMRRLARSGRSAMAGVRTMAHIFGEQGTAAGAAMSAESGDAPIRNWAGVGYRDFPILGKSERISGRNVSKYKTNRYGCGGVCPLVCGGHVQVPSGKHQVNRTRKPEYETLASFGMMSLNDDVESIIKCNDICNSYGLDTLSTGATVAFAIECFEAGIISASDTDGLELAWGDADAIVTLTESIARRKGFGAVLADGVARATERIGQGADAYAIHIHGQEPGMHDPKYGPSWATTYVADPTPGRHTAGGAVKAEIYRAKMPLPGVEVPGIERHVYSGKGPVQAAWSNFDQMVNCLGLCMMAGILGALPYLDLVNATTGWDWTGQEYLSAGERIQTMRQLFNVREGLKPGDFKLPERLRGDPAPTDGPSAGITVDVDTMVADYFDAMGWDKDSGRPSEARLKALGLAELVQDVG